MLTRWVLQQMSMVAFVAPWCGHCQSMAPEYSKAAKSLAPLIPLYAVDCDEEKNKPLCGRQGVKGFPTIKVYPRGGKSLGMNYEGERKAGAISKYATKIIPNTVKVLKTVESIVEWAAQVSGLNVSY